MYIQDSLKKKFTKVDGGLYRNDGLAISQHGDECTLDTFAKDFISIGLKNHHH